MRILIAEDDFTSRTLLMAVLQKCNYDPVPTENGIQAWEVLQRPDSPKLVLLDWNMPGLDGLEVTRRVRALNVASPPYILLLTSNSEKNQIIAGLDAGANDYMIKPFDTGELRARLGVGRRMVELQDALLAARDALEHQAMHDVLTGVFNRRAIMDALTSEIARAKRENTSLIVGICDIDYFKKVNDNYGHLVGDEVLCGFANRLGSQLRPYDHLGRWGGEEFLVIAPERDAHEGGGMFERIRRAVSDTPFLTSAGNLSITVSIGVVALSGNVTGDILVSAADMALYKAKSLGRNRVCIAD
ncbi:MAG: diguanylate cyclase [bacterium]